MLDVLSFIASNASALGVVGAAIAFIWPVVQFVMVRKREQQQKEFEAFHRLVKELVSPDPESKVAWIDRQAAVAFELRRFTFYHEYTYRMLLSLRVRWANDPEFAYPRLIEEIDLTVNHIRDKQKSKAWVTYSPSTK